LAAAAGAADSRKNSGPDLHLFLFNGKTARTAKLPHFADNFIKSWPCTFFTFLSAVSFSAKRDDRAYCSLPRYIAGTYVIVRSVALLTTIVTLPLADTKCQQTIIRLKPTPNRVAK
jgi:hypothetical protein